MPLPLLSRMVTEDKDGVFTARFAGRGSAGERQLRRIEAIADPYAMQPQSIMEEQESRRELYDGLKRLTQQSLSAVPLWLHRWRGTSFDRHGDMLPPDEKPRQKDREQAMDNLWLELPWWFD